MLEKSGSGVIEGGLADTSNDASKEFSHDTTEDDGEVGLLSRWRRGRWHYNRVYCVKVKPVAVYLSVMTMSHLLIIGQKKNQHLLRRL